MMIPDIISTHDFMRGTGVLLGAFLILLLISPVSGAYSFQEAASSPDSVRLVLNQSRSHDDIVSLDVFAQEVSNIESAGFDLSFDDSIVEWAGDDNNDPEGFGKGYFFDDSVWYAIGHEKYLDFNGTLTINNSKLVVGIVGESGNTKSGSGTIISVNFRIVGIGTSHISFSNSALILSGGSPSGSSWNGGTLVVDDIPSPAQEQDDPPQVSLLSPDDSSVLSSGDVELACEVSDDNDIANITLFTNIGGPWNPYSTKYVSGLYQVASFQLVGLSENIYTWNCRASDSAGQTAFASSDRTFTVSLPADSTPPVRTNGAPSGSLSDGTGLELYVETNEDATCRYSNSPGIPYGAIPYSLDTSDSRTHSTTLNLPSDHSYSYYVRCVDQNGNENDDDYVISFTVGTPSVPTCQSSGYSCCDSCQSGTEHSSYDGDCPGQVCCGTCEAVSQYFLPEVIVEAEDGDLTSPMVGTTGSGASGEYVSSGTSNQGSVSYTFNITQAGRYSMDARILTPDPQGAHDSFYIGTDGYNPRAAGNEEYTYDIVQASSFTWDNVSLRGPTGDPDSSEYDPMVWDLDADLHTFTFYTRESNTMLDQIILRRVYHPADNNPRNGCILINELLAYITAWYQDSTANTITNLIEAITLWKAGTGC
jgi:hypothetical protein